MKIIKKKQKLKKILEFKKINKKKVKIKRKKLKLEF